MGNLCPLNRTNYPYHVDEQILSDGFVYGFKVAIGYKGPGLPKKGHKLIKHNKQKELEI